MEIGKIIKDVQPDEYSKLKIRKDKKHSKKPKKKSKEKFTEGYVKELMGHSSYKRQGGAIRQVR